MVGESLKLTSPAPLNVSVIPHHLRPLNYELSEDRAKNHIVTETCINEREKKKVND